MKITIESTDKITMMGQVPVRVWLGTTEKGTRCYVFVHRLAVHEDESQAEFENELLKMPPVEFISVGELLSKKADQPSARIENERPL